MNQQPTHHWHLPPWFDALKRQLQPKEILLLTNAGVDTLGHVAIGFFTLLFKLSFTGLQLFKKINWRRLIKSAMNNFRSLISFALYFATHRQALIPAVLAFTHDFRLSLKYLIRHPRATPQYLAYLVRQTTPATRVGMGLAGLGLILGLFLPTLVTQYSPFAPEPTLEFKRSWLSGYAVQATSPQGEITSKLGTTRDGLKLQVERGEYSLDLQTKVAALDLTVDKGEANYQNDQQSIKIEYQLVENGLKESIVLALDPRTNTFVSTITTEGLIPYLTPEQQIVFYNEEGEYQFHFETPFAFDAAGSTTHGVKYTIEPIEDTNETAPDLVSPLGAVPEDNVSTGLLLDQLSKTLLGENKSSVSHFQLPDSYTLTLTVDPLWLNNPNRVYPITIDPTVVHDTTAEFATGQLNRVKDTGSGSFPKLETYYQELPADENTIALLHMNEGTANTCTGGANDVCDTSGNVLDGAFGNNAAFLGSGVLGDDAVTLDGTDDYVEIADNDRLSQWSNGLTMEGWFNADTITTANYTTVMGKGTTSNWEYVLYFDITTGYPMCVTYTAAGSIIYQATATFQPSLDTWHHLACGFDTNGVVVYLDGKEIARDATAAVANVMTNGTGAFRVGMRTDNFGNEFDGYVDEVRLSNRLRSAEEIRLAASRRPYSVYTSDTIDLTSYEGLNGEALYDDTGLIAQWNYNETSGTSLTSSAGTCGSNCTLTLGAGFTNTSGQDVVADSGWTSTNKRWGSGGLMYDSNDITSRGAVGSSFNFVDGDDYSWEGWAKTATDGKLMYQLQSGSQLMYISVGATTAGGTANKLVTYLRSDAGTDLLVLSGTTTITDNQWHHLAVVVDDTGATRTVNLYVDGVLDNTSAWNSTGAMTLAASGLNFGTGVYSFTGVRDTTRFYKRALSASEVASNARVTDFQWDERGVATGDGETASSSASLVAQWNLNETSGTTGANNAGSTTCGGTGTNCDLTLTNVDSTASQDADPDSSWTANNKRWGAGALQFDGINSYTACTDANCGGAGKLDFVAADSFTTTAWIKKNTSVNATEHMLGKGDFTAIIGYDMYVNSNTARCIYKDGTNFPAVNSNVNVNDGNWHYVVCIRDVAADQLSIYVDGLLRATATDTTTGTLANDDSFVIGAGNNGSSNFFTGTIDTVSVYSRALPYHEILSNYNVGTIEFQTRTSTDGSTWEAWKPTTSETAVNTFDTDAGNWAWDSSVTSLVEAKSNESTIIQEGSGSLQVDVGKLQTDASTVALWHLDETNGDNAGVDIFDTTTNNHDGEFSGSAIATAVTEGISGKARSFNGSDDYIDIGTGPNSVKTIEFWVKPATTTEYFINTTGTSTYIWVNNEAVTATGFTSPTTYVNGVATDKLKANTWQHVAITTATAVNASNLDVGRTADANYLEGSIDEIRFSSTTRTANEIAEAYRLGRDHYLNKTISSTDLSGKTHLPYYVAADRPGTYLESTVGESAYANYQPDSNTVAFWHLDEQYGSGAYLLDSSGNSNHLTPANSPTFTPGKLGMARFFNGSTQYADSPASITGYAASDPLTLEAWFVTLVDGTNNIIVDSNLRARLEITTGNQIRGLIGTGAGWCSLTVLGPVLTSGQTYHAALTYDNTTAKLYLNGQLVYSEALSCSTTTFTTIRVGEYTAGGAFYFPGIIDEVRLSKVARSASDIRQAFEVGKRSHQVTIDFAADLDSGNLITGSGDLSFTVDSTAYGLEDKGSMLFEEDKIIVRETVDATEYIAQGDVTAVTASTGAVTIDAWDTGSTFPTGGFTTNAVVFKWQREYIDLTGLTDDQINATTNLTLRVTNGLEGRTVWLDDLKSTGGYITNPDAAVAQITSTPDRYFQYRAIISSSDPAVSPWLEDVTLDYTANTKPYIPSLDAPTDTVTTQLLAPVLRTTTTDIDSDYLRYKIELCTNLAMTTGCQTFDQTVSQTGWSGQNAQTSTAYSSGTQGVYTVQTTLVANTTYYWRSYAIDPGGSNTWSSTQSTPYSFTTSVIPSPPDTLWTESSTNPTGVTDLTPEFSAIYRDDDVSDAALYYRIQVNTAADFETGTTMWDSGQTSMTSTATDARSPDLSYAGTALTLNGTTYYWRIKFWDTAGNEGVWSTESATFAMASVYAPTACTLVRADDNSSITFNWNDPNTLETGYEIQRSTNGGAFAAWLTLGANNITQIDSAVSTGDTYQYRVRATHTTENSAWCTTATLSPDVGNFGFEGINLEGLNID